MVCWVRLGFICIGLEGLMFEYRCVGEKGLCVCYMGLVIGIIDESYLGGFIIKEVWRRLLLVDL